MPNALDAYYRNMLTERRIEDVVRALDAMPDSVGAVLEPDAKETVRALCRFHVIAAEEAARRYDAGHRADSDLARLIRRATEAARCAGEEADRAMSALEDVAAKLKVVT